MACMHAAAYSEILAVDSPRAVCGNMSGASLGRPLQDRHWHAHGRIQKVDWLHAHQNYNEPILVSMAAFQLRTLSTGRPRSRRIWHWRASCSNTFVGTLAHAMLTTCLRSFGGSIWPSVPLSMRTPKLLGEPVLSLYVRMANRNCPAGISHVQWSTWAPCP